MTLKDELREAVLEYSRCQANEANADPDYIEVAIQETNAAKMKIDAIIKKGKLSLLS